MEGRGRQRGRSRLLTEQGAWLRVPSQIPGIMTWAKGRHLTDWATQVPIESVFLCPLDKCLVVQLLDLRVVLFLTFWGISIVFSRVAAPCNFKQPRDPSYQLSIIELFQIAKHPSSSILPHFWWLCRDRSLEMELLHQRWEHLKNVWYILPVSF